MATIPHAKPKPRVLLIEDNLVQLDLYAFALAPDVDVIPASRGALGYALACADQPDVIMIDVLLPDADGLDLATRLRTNPETSHISLVVLTGDDAAYAKARVMTDTVDAVLRKPCPADTLVQTSREVIGIRRLPAG